MRATGLRSTPQRRAILAAFGGGASEHLSADEVYARAAVSLPDLGRGTVYATLAEFTEVGLLAAFGTPEPVRYETHTGRHAHFRCRICLRIFDVDGDPQDLGPFERQAHRVEVLDLRAEGVCRECNDYEAALESAVGEIFASGASDPLKELEFAAVEVDTPIGSLLLAATVNGLARVAFPEHGDVAFLRRQIGEEAPAAAAAHLAKAAEELGRYFAGERLIFTCTIDWETVGFGEALRAAAEVPYGTTRAYHLLAAADDVTDRGRAYGANPIAIVSPCHRVTRGAVLPDKFVGGSERRTWLLEFERSTLGQ